MVATGSKGADMAVRVGTLERADTTEVTGVAVVTGGAKNRK